MSDSGRIGALFHVVIDLERIGDHAMNIVENAEKKRQQKLVFTEDGKKEIVQMYEKVFSLYEKSLTMFVTSEKDNIEEIIALENEVDQMDIELQKQQVKRLSKGECSVETGLIFTDMVIGLERIADHATNIAEWVLYSITGER